VYIYEYILYISHFRQFQWLFIALFFPQEEEELDVNERKKLKKLKAAVSDSSEEEEGEFFQPPSARTKTKCV